MVYLLWITLVAGGGFMGVGAVLTLVQQGFEPFLALNALLYLGCALYALPRLVRLFLGSRP